jgi:predicted RNA methylase
MISIVDKIQRSLATNGIMDTIRLCGATTIQYLPSKRCNRTLVRAHDLEFDQEWGVDTSGFLVPDKSEVVGSNWIYGTRYQGCDATALHELLSDLSIQYELFTFIDFGSGKGRAILTASRFPFRNVIGVEYSEHLNEIAKRNLSRFQKAAKKAKLIDVMCADAAKFQIPEDPLVIFLYHPFGRSVMEDVVNNVVTSFQRNPRRIIVLYSNARFVDVWKNTGFLHEIRISKNITTYDTQRS